MAYRPQTAVSVIVIFVVDVLSQLGFSKKRDDTLSLFSLSTHWDECVFDYPVTSIPFLEELYRMLAPTGSTLRSSATLLSVI